MKKRNILLVSMILIVAIFASACAAAQSTAEDKMPAAGGDNEYVMSEESLEMEGVTAESPRSYDSGVGESAAAPERMVIYNANLRIAVETQLPHLIRSLRWRRVRVGSWFIPISTSPPPPAAKRCLMPM